MKKLRGLIYFTTGLILSITLVLFSGSAQAYIYDDFTSSGIDSSRWVDTGPNYGLFSQPGDGYLYFNDSSGGQVDILRSYNPVSGAFALAMQYSNFQAISDTPAGSGQGSSVSLRLDDGINSMSTMQYKNELGLGFQAVAFIGSTRISLNFVPTTLNSGWLGIDYNGITGPGGEVDFWYDSGAGRMLLASFAPNFSQSPYFLIRGADTYGEALSFQVDQVQVCPTPLPASVMLLGTGLGLAGCRKLRKR
jgi:hypothetical protein